MSREDDFTNSLLKLWMARALEGESQIEERIDWNTETKGRVPLVQMATAAIGLLAVLVGLGLLGSQAAWLFDLDLTIGDYLLVTVFGLLVCLLVMAAVRVLSNTNNRNTVLLVTGAILVVLVGAILAAVVSKRQELDILHSGAIMFGIALFLPGLALSYRQLTDLVDPFGKTSPMERMIYPYLDVLLGAQAQPDPELARLIPHRVSGHTQAISSNGAFQVHPDDLNLIAFIREASLRGLARADLVTDPRIKLRPTGTELTRDVYDTLLHRASDEWGFIRRGGGGHASVWLIEPAQALTLLEEEAKRVQDA